MGFSFKGKDEKKVKIAFAVIAISLLIISGILVIKGFIGSDGGGLVLEITDVLDLVSERRTGSYDHIILESDDRMGALVAVPLACWYDITDGSSELFPLLVGKNDATERFTSYTQPADELYIEDLPEKTAERFHNSAELARMAFVGSAGFMLISDSDEGYELGLISAPMASYLNIPALVADDRIHTYEVSSFSNDLGCTYVIAVGEEAVDIARNAGLNRIEIMNGTEAFLDTATVVEDRFSRLDYMTLTNPMDTIAPYLENDIMDERSQDVDSILVDTGSRDLDLLGESVMTHDIEVLEGIVNLRINVNFTDIQAHPLDPFKDRLNVDPMSFLTLTDTEGNLVASSPSFAVGYGKNFVESLVVDHPGTYRLEVKVYYGVKGLSTMMGTSFGISRLEGTYSIETHNRVLSQSHLPMYEDLSMMAPYLSASRGGLVIASSDLSLYRPEDIDEYRGYSSGPWYQKDLLEFGKNRAENNAEILRSRIDMLPEELKNTYISEHGWLALLGGGNMIPMSYEEKDPSWVENEIWGTGWATDLPYSLDLVLSVGRPLGRDLSDVSALIARTLFYEEYTEGHIEAMSIKYGNSGTFKDHFHFLAGEGGGRTGWLFHQREFSAIAEDHGFISEVYMQDYENGREYMVSQGAFERANYFEMILHGDWSWFSPELNGWDRYSTGVRVTDIMREPLDWQLGPSVFNSGVCLLGRLGGLRPEQSITQAFFHAGINAFFCSTRSTGSEAKAGPIEEALLFEDLSTGEAIRKDKRDNPAPPTFFVRTLYGDPAFNPYEPENGYGDQGRPQTVRSLA